VRNGFVLHRQSGTSHAIYRREQAAEVRSVVVAAHNLKEEIKWYSAIDDPPIRIAEASLSKMSSAFFRRAYYSPYERRSRGGF
jgi:hypothetical protein